MTSPFKVPLAKHSNCLTISPSMSWKELLPLIRSGQSFSLSAEVLHIDTPECLDYILRLQFASLTIKVEVTIPPEDQGVLTSLVKQTLSRGSNLWLYVNGALQVRVEDGYIGYRFGDGTVNRGRLLLQHNRLELLMQPHPEVTHLWIEGCPKSIDTLFFLIHKSLPNLSVFRCSFSVPFRYLLDLPNLSIVQGEVIIEGDYDPQYCPPNLKEIWVSSSQVERGLKLGVGVWILTPKEEVSEMFKYQEVPGVLGLKVV